MEKTTNVHGVQVGDIFYSSWGYDQTNVDYFEVVKVTAKMATVKEISAVQNPYGPMHGKCAPVPGQYKDNCFFGEQNRTATDLSWNGEQPILKNADSRGHLGYLYTGDPQFYSEWR